MPRGRPVILRRYRVNPTEVQAWVLSKPAFTAREAIAFARRRGARKVEETRGTFRIRMQDPARLRAQGYRRARMLTVAPSVKAVIFAKGPRARSRRRL